MLRPSAAPLLAALAVLPPAAAAQECTPQNVQAAERSCFDVFAAGRFKYMCSEALAMMDEKCQREFRRRGETYPPRDAEHPARLLRALRRRYLIAPNPPDRAADSSGIALPGSADHIPSEHIRLRERPLNDDGDGGPQTEAAAVAPLHPHPVMQEPPLSESLRDATPRLSGGAAQADTADVLARIALPPLFVPPPLAAADAARGLAGNESQQALLAAPAGLRAEENAGAQLSAVTSAGLGRGLGSLMERIQRHQPRSAETALVAGLLYQQTGRPAQAAAALSRVVALQPDFGPAYQYRAQARLAYGDAEGARADAQTALKLDPENAQAKRLLGQARELSESASRIGAMEIGFGAGTDAPEIDGAVAAGKSGSGAPRPAELTGEALERAAAASIVLPAGGKGLAGAPPSVRRWLEGLAPEPARFQALPASTRGLWLSALENAAIGRWKPALEDATLLTQADPEDGGPWLLRSKVLGRLVNWKAAESDARRALEKAPEDPAALLELGYAQLQQGRAEEGLATIDRALALAPNSGLGQLYRAEALEKLGRAQEALSAYRLAASLDPVLRPLTEQALARLEPRGARPEPSRKGAPPWRRTLLVVAALVGGLLALKGAQQFGVLGGRVRHEAAETALAAREQPLSEHRPGDVIGGHFQVEKELARGGMGVVYLATDTMLRRRVAIKRLNEQAYASEDARRKFLQEAQLAARLKHPNLAAIHSVFGDRELYLVFEYVEGKGLDAALAERGRLGLHEAREIVRQVCGGLAHAHEGRVIHRDLKPANVMLGADGAAKILDFGIAHQARTVSSATLTQAWGTPPYMAPEQEDGYVSPASDLYAVGVMAYELLAGQRPFEGPDQLGLKRSGSFAKLGGRHGLPPEADRFFARALHPDPAQRFARASDLAHAFDELAGTPVRS